MNLFRTIIRYLKVLKAFSLMNLMDQMAYPHNFWFAIIMKAARVGIVVIFFKAIYLKVNTISGWNYADTIFIFATFSLIDFIMSVTFFRNFVFWFSELLANGDFDYRLVKPINLQFYTGFWVIDFMDLTTIAPIAILYWYALNQMSTVLSAINVISYLVLVVNALIFVYSLVLILSTFNFWKVKSTGIGRFAQGLLWIGRYPTDIYYGAWRTIFSYIFPIAFIATWPAKAFLGILSWQNLIYALTFTAVFFWLANGFWNYGLKHYSSASS